MFLSKFSDNLMIWIRFLTIFCNKIPSMIIDKFSLFWKESMNYVSAQMCPDFLEMIDNKKMNEKYVSR